MVMNEIRDSIISIICTIMFFMVGTIMWYQLHLNYESINNTLNNLQKELVYENIVLKDLKQISDKQAPKLESYRFVLNNKDTLCYLDNNNIVYDNLDANSESVYEIKLWVSDNYQNEFNYHGNLVVVYV